MEIKKIYFDMDGVLADFSRGVEELCGLPSDCDELVAGQEFCVKMHKMH